MESPFDSLSPTGRKLFIGLVLLLTVTLTVALGAAIFAKGLGE